MKNKNIEFGVFIVSIGVLMLLGNIGVISWSIFDALIELWPALFIVIGVDIIFRNNSIVKAIMWILFIVALVMYGSYYKGENQWESNKEDSRNVVAVEKKESVDSGVLKLDLGAIDVRLNSTEQNLVDGDLSSKYIKYNVNYGSSGKEAFVEFTNNHQASFKNKGYEARIRINKDIPWDIDANLGASKGTLDMSNLKVNNLDISAGASSLNIILGDKSNIIKGKVDAGASSIKITIPKNLGVKLRVDGALNSTNISSLNLNRQGDYYVSSNYENAKSRVDMDIQMGVGSLTIDIQK